MTAFINQLARLTRLTEFRVFSAGVFLVAVVLSAVGIFSERIELAMQERTAAMLGADAEISSSRPMDAQYEVLALEAGLETARSISFLSMAMGGDETKLAGVRAVTSNYPLKGEIIVRTDSGSKVAHSAPAPGRILAATPLVTQLDLNGLGQVQLGELDFQFEREILFEPEGGGGMLRMAPRIIMNIEDIEATGLVTPASRARFRLLVSGEQDKVNAFLDRLTPNLQPHESWEVADVERDEVRTTVGRIVSYIRLASLLTLILSMIAMAVAAQGLWKQQIHSVALLRCLGQSHNATVKSLSLRYLTLILPIAAVGIAIGYVFQQLAIGFIGESMGLDLPGSGFQPLFASLGMSVVVAATILFPIVLATKRIPAMSLLRYGPTDRTHSNRATLFGLGLLILAVTLLLARNIELASGVLISLALAAMSLWLVIRLIIAMMHKFIPPRPYPWFVALKTITSNGGRSAWLISAFSMTIFALALLGIIRTDIFYAWQQGVPDDAKQC